MSMHYLNGQETALIKLGFMGMTPEQLKLIAAQTGMGAVGGGAAGALMAGEGNRLEGGLAGAAAGGFLAGGASRLGRKLDNEQLRELEMMYGDSKFPAVIEEMDAARKIPHSPVTAGKALAGAPFGAVAGAGTGALVNGTRGEDKTASKSAHGLHNLQRPNSSQG